MTIYTQFRYWLQFLLITMSNRQNYDPNASIHRYPSLVLATDQDLEADNPLLNASSFDNELGNSKGNNFIDRLDFLVADSLRTISRGSLDICPQAPSMDINTNIQEEIPSTLKSSRKSLIFEEPEEPQEQKQLNLIAKTDELSLNGGEQDLEADIFSAYSPKKHRALVKTQRPKIHHISQPKQLIRQLKREHKYNDSIIADIVIAVDNKISKLKHANIKPIISDKGHLSGLIIVNADNQLKVRVVNQKSHIFDPKLQLWDQNHQEWMQFDFKVKIRNA